MDRQTVYRDQIPYESDFLNAQRYAYQGFGLFLLDLIGPDTQVGGFPAVPTSPASMSVEVGPGRIYKLEPLDTTAWGELDGSGGVPAVADADNQILKQGIMAETVTFLITAPPTGGHSQKYLIEGEFTEVEAAAVTSQFYNVDNPSAPISEDVSPTRRNVATLYLKAGTPGASPAVPAVTAGRVPIWVVTVANGDTTITSGDIVAHDDAPFVAVTGGGGGSGLANWQVLTSNHTAVDGERIIADTTAGAFTLTLPAAPSAGDEVTIKGDFLTNNLTVGRNGQTIAGSATDLTLDKNNVTAFLVFDGTTWRV
jgi:hypothetical protein